MLEKAINFFDNKEYEKAYSLFLEMAKKEDRVAQYYLGVKENQREGFKWFLASAEQGYADAQYVVAKSYIAIHSWSRGIEMSNQEFEESKRRVKEDPYYVPVDIAHGVGVKQSNNEGLKWLLKAISNYSFEAKITLDTFYYLEVKDNLHHYEKEVIDDLIDYYKKEFQNKMEELSFENYVNPFCEKGYEKKEEYFQKDDIYDLYHLGLAYAYGEIGEINYLKAYECYQKAMTHVKDRNELRQFNVHKLRFNIGNLDARKKALNGDVNAQLYKGCLYEWGFEIKRDLEEAIYWYNMAYEQGSLEAKKRLEVIKSDKR